MLSADATGDAFSALFGMAIGAGINALVVFAIIWFFRGPAQAAENYVSALAMQFQSPADGMLFRQIYQTKGPKSTSVAWLLTLFLSPAISYIYQAKWGLATIAFLTLQGFGFWWLIAIFTMPSEVFAKNKRLADEAFQQVVLSRGSGALGYATGALDHLVGAPGLGAVSAPAIAVPMSPSAAPSRGV